MNPPSWVNSVSSILLLSTKIFLLFTWLRVVWKVWIPWSIPWVLFVNHTLPSLYWNIISLILLFALKYSESNWETSFNFSPSLKTVQNMNFFELDRFTGTLLMDFSISRFCFSEVFCKFLLLRWNVFGMQISLQNPKFIFNSNSAGACFFWGWMTIGRINFLLNP